MAKIDELHNYAYPDKYLDELHIYDKSIGNSGGFDEVHNYGNRGVTYGMDELHLYGSYQTVETSEDEINTPSEAEVIDIDKYFDEIEELDEEQKQERKDLAEEFKEILKLVFMLFLADLRAGNTINEGFYHSLAKSRLMDAVDRKLPHLSATIYVEIENYINQNLNYIIETTMRHTDDAYYFSEARATAIAVDDAMATVNLSELDEAIKAGYTHKIWVTMRDNKVRHTHEIADGQKVEIKKTFKVGRCKMQAPMVFDEDSEYQDAKEVIHCRCFMVYSNKTQKPQEDDTIRSEMAKQNKGTQIASTAITNLYDEYVGKSVGAKFQNYDIMNLLTGEKYHIAEGTHIRNKTVFAGKGSNTPYRNAQKYADKYGGNAEDWQHVKATATLDTPDGLRDADVHWSQCEEVGKVDFFVKSWLDES